jgi:RNA recognition motif. (a.k.a. RRM, RBD, or RNP domain)
MSNRKSTLFVKNFVKSIQPIEATEESLKSYFSYYGKVKNCAIPKDYYSSKPKGYAFINFYTEKDSKFAYDNCGDRLFMDKLLLVKYAHEKKNSRSRSRSPSNSLKIDLEIQSEIEKLLKTKEESIKKNNEILLENEKLAKELKELLGLKKTLKNQIKAYRTGKVVCLPCGHSKLISLQENAFFEEISSHALQILSSKESENPIIQKHLKTRILDILNAKLGGSFKCQEIETFILGNCGHLYTGECSQVNSFKKGDQAIECQKLVEKLLPCGHTQIVQCYKEFEISLCKNC